MNHPEDILAAVDTLTARYGRPPTVREIGAQVGLTSTSTVQAHIETLLRWGELERVPNSPRSLRRPASRDPRRARVLHLARQYEALAFALWTQGPPAQLCYGVACGLLLALAELEPWRPEVRRSA